MCGVFKANKAECTRLVNFARSDWTIWLENLAEVSLTVGLRGVKLRRKVFDEEICESFRLAWLAIRAWHKSLN